MSGQISTRGPIFCKHLDETLRKGVYETQIPSMGFIYEVSTTINPDYHVGDRVVLPDGREYRYAKSSGVCGTSSAAEFVYTGIIAYVAATEAVAAGETKVTVPATCSHAAAIAIDELRGGYLVIHGSVTHGRDMMFRGIVGNDYSAIDAAITLYLDGPLDVAIDTSSAYEVFENPYASVVGLGNNGHNQQAKAGVAAAYVSAANMYFWLKIKGPCFLNSQASVDGGHTGCYWRHDGIIQGAIAVGSASLADDQTDTTQYAGYRISGEKADNGPLFMLRC